MRSIVIGTAGHIDHGKTALVQALTGTDCDRLKEEKERGITIELGFAHLDLPHQLQASVVDVPGHERFVKNMVAGTYGIDLVLLVIAADEGVMPQTREHVDICALLGVQRGVVALTKVDLIDSTEWLEMVQEEVRSELAGTLFEQSPIVPVSSRSRQGIDELIRVLGAEGARIPGRALDAPAFLGIDRAFSIHGFGTVVTGTLVAGSFQVNDEVDVLPDPSGKLKGLKIRGLQAHGQSTEKVTAGQRAAVNLSGIERSLLTRGQVLVQAGSLEVGHDLECALQLVPGAQARSIRTRALFHTGTAKSAAVVRLIDRESLEPGEKAYVRIHCVDPLAALPGHRYILRGTRILPGRGTTLGGGQIITILPPRRTRRQRRHLAEELSTLESASSAARLCILLQHAGLNGANLTELRMRSGLGTNTLARETDRLMAERKIFKFDRDQGRFVEASVVEGLCLRLEGLLASFHADHPLLPGMSGEQLRVSLHPTLAPRLYKLLLDQETQRKKLTLEGDHVRLSSHRVQLSASRSRLTESVQRRYELAALAPPRIEELACEVEQSADEILELIRHLARTGVLTHITADMYLHSAALQGLRVQLISFLKQRGEITTQEFKTLVGGTRKHVIPLAEYFDREKLTLRVGEKRVLRKKDV